MLKFSQYESGQYLLDEGLKSFLSSLKRKIASSFRSAMKKIRGLKAGQSVKIPVSVPKNMSEAKQKQTGKKGGELAEVAMLKKLYALLKKKNIEVEYGYPDGSPMSTNAFNKEYRKNLDSYRKQEGSNKVKREKDWISHGEAGAVHIMQYLEGLPGDWDLYKIRLEHLGEALTGTSKGDVNIVVQVKSTEEILDYIGHLSVKTSLDGTPFDSPSNGLQTSWDTFVIQLLTGETSRNQGFKSAAGVVKKIEQAEAKFSRASASLEQWQEKLSNASTAGRIATAQNKIANFEEKVAEAQELILQAQEMHKDTREYQLDQLGEKIGHKGPLSEYMKDLIATFNDYYASPGSANAKDPKKRKKASVVQANVNAAYEYTEIIRKAVESKLSKRSEKQKMIQGIMALGGIETGLDYLALGADKDSKEGKKISAAVSTLGNEDYKKIKETLLGTLNASVTRKNEFTLLFHVMKGRKVLFSFPLYKEINNARILLPQFEGPDNTKLSLLKRYAQGYYAPGEEPTTLPGFD